MARVALAKIQAEVYAALNVDGGTYGTYVANERYPSAAIDDAIYIADNFVAKLLAKDGQETLMYENADHIDLADGGYYGTPHVILSVIDSPTSMPLVEIDYSDYETMKANTSGFKTTTYYGYYCLKDGRIFLLNNGKQARITYLNFPSNNVLKSPDGFESIIAYRAAHVLLMKRGDNPEASKFYGDKFTEELQAHIQIPEISTQDFVEK